MGWLRGGWVARRMIYIARWSSSFMFLMIQTKKNIYLPRTLYIEQGTVRVRIALRWASLGISLCGKARGRKRKKEDEDNEACFWRLTSMRADNFELTWICHREIVGIEKLVEQLLLHSFLTLFKLWSTFWFLKLKSVIEFILSYFFFNPPCSHAHLSCNCSLCYCLIDMWTMLTYLNVN